MKYFVLPQNVYNFHKTCFQLYRLVGFSFLFSLMFLFPIVQIKST